MRIAQYKVIILESKMRSVAHALGKQEEGIDSKTQGVSLLFEEDELRLLYREVIKSADLPNTTEVSYRGKIVYKRTPSDKKPKLYQPGEWEQKIENKFEELVKKEKERDPPF